MAVKAKLEDIFKGASPQELERRAEEEHAKFSAELDRDKQKYIVHLEELIKKGDPIVKKGLEENPNNDIMKQFVFWVKEARDVINKINALTPKSPWREAQEEFERCKRIAQQLNLFILYHGRQLKEAAGVGDLASMEKARKEELRKKRESFQSSIPYSYEDIKKLDSYKRILTLGATDTTSEILKKRRVVRFSVDAATLNEDIFQPAAPKDVAQRQRDYKERQAREEIRNFISSLTQRGGRTETENSFLKLIFSTLPPGPMTDFDKIESADSRTIKKIKEIIKRFYFLSNASKHYLVYPNGYLRYWDWRGDPRAGILEKFDPALTLAAYSRLLERMYQTIERRTKKIKDIKRSLDLPKDPSSNLDTPWKVYPRQVDEDIFEPADLTDVKGRRSGEFERIKEKFKPGTKIKYTYHDTDTNTTFFEYGEVVRVRCPTPPPMRTNLGPIYDHIIIDVLIHTDSYGKKIERVYNLHPDNPNMEIIDEDIFKAAGSGEVEKRKGTQRQTQIDYYKKLQYEYDRLRHLYYTAEDRHEREGLDLELNRLESELACVGCDDEKGTENCKHCGQILCPTCYKNNQGYCTDCHNIDDPEGILETNKLVKDVKDIFEPASREEASRRNKSYWTQERIREDIMDFLRNIGSYGSLAATARQIGILRGDWSPSTDQLLSALDKATSKMSRNEIMKLRKWLLGADFVETQRP